MKSKNKLSTYTSRKEGKKEDKEKEKRKVIEGKREKGNLITGTFFCAFHTLNFFKL